MTTRTLGWILLTLGLVLAPLHFVDPPAAAQTTPVIGIADIVVNDVNGTFTVIINLASGTTPVTGFQVMVGYDPAIIQPVLNTDPFAGTLGAPQCTNLNGAAAACGPPNPANEINVSAFRATGAWQGDFDLVAIEFVAQGVTGVSPLSITLTQLLDFNANAILGDTDDGLVTISVDEPTSTPAPIPGNADLSIAKSAAVSGPLLPGSTLDYTITGTNAGPDPATDVIITDSLPAGLSFVAPPSASGWTCSINGQAFTCTRPTLPVGQNFVFTYEIVVDDDVTPDATLTNVVNVSGATTDSDIANNSASAPVTTAPDTATPTPNPTGPTATATPQPTGPTATATPQPTGPTATATPQPTNPTTTPTPDGPDPTPTPSATPDPTGPTSTPVPATATPTPLPASATPTVTPTPAVTPRPNTPLLPPADPPLEYPGPFNNPPPSGAFGDGFKAQPNDNSFLDAIGDQPAGTDTGASSTADTAADGSTSLAVTGAETPVLTTISLSLIALGGLLLVIARREDTDS